MKHVLTASESARIAAKARMAKMTKKERSELGRRAVQIRWARKKNPRGSGGKFIAKK